MKYNFFLFLLTTFAAVAVAKPRSADGKIECDGTSCQYIVTIPIDKEVFVGQHESSLEGSKSFTGDVDSDDFTALYTDTKKFKYNSENDGITFFGNHDNKLGEFNVSLNENGQGIGKWN
jgi:hypothetical protein